MFENVTEFNITGANTNLKVFSKINFLNFDFFYVGYLDNKKCNHYLNHALFLIYNNHTNMDINFVYTINCTYLFTQLNRNHKKEI